MKPMHRLVLAVTCWACLGAASTAAPPPNAPQWQRLQEQLEEQKKAADELKTNNKDLQDRIKAQETALLETQRKSIDWWLALLGALGGAMAVMFGALPLLIAYKEREAIKDKLAEAKELLGHIRVHADKAESITADMGTLNQYRSGQTETAQERAQIVQEAKQVQKSPTLSDKDRLRAQAVEASQVESPTLEQAKHAYELWKALTVLDGTDQNAHFNAGYWAQELYKQMGPANKKHWFEALCHHYELLPASHEAANNLGTALDDEAKALAKTDLMQARRLWTQAGEKYSQALRIKADKHETIYNWGIALMAEAKELAMIDLTEARKLWALAGEKYALALRIKTDMYEAANNWGSALDDEATELAKTDLTEARKLWALAGEKYAQALQINADIHEAASNWGSVLMAEANALAKNDLTEARKIWALAGEKYAQALRIKPDMHEAANYRGTAHCHEIHALRDANQPELAMDVLQKAMTLLEVHGAQYPDTAPMLAYNLACVYGLAGRATDAVAQLELSRQTGRLPSHWPEDKDFDAIRSSPEFIKWAATHAPSTLPPGKST